MIQRPAYFYQFTGLHGFLTGLMPFFIPVILWRESESMALISAFIALSGVAYLGSLVVWEKLRSSQHGKLAVAGSYIAEAVLISALIIEGSQDGLSVTGVTSLAVLNGAYGCFYWLSLRMLFIQQTADSVSSSGNRFGNFQLVVGILLKVGILVGATLLERDQALWLVVITWMISMIGVFSVYSPANHRSISSALSSAPVKLVDIKTLELGDKVRAIFVLDGLFLFLESYFWVLSLYQLSSESYARLGTLVVGLAIALSLMFLVIKKWIDRTDAVRVFQIAVVLYAVSWALRGWVDISLETTLFSIMVMAIAFMTSFFRLSFNKLYFDRIKRSQSQVYILAKSWYSQLGVAIFFSLLSIVFLFIGEEAVITNIYWLSAPLALSYIRYTRQTSTSDNPVYL